MSNQFLTPPEVMEFTIETGAKKAALPVFKMLLLGFMAGVFIALGSQGSNIATHTIESVGIAKLVGGVLFPAGLILVVVAGGELFTGNNLIILACLDKRAKWVNFLKNLLVVFIGNLIGSLFVVFLISRSGQLDYTSAALGGYTIRVAAGKVNLSFGTAFFSGLLCNIPVCLAVWASYAAKDIAGKILAIFFPIWIFVLSGFEHCVANMYFIPAGILAMGNPDYVSQAQAVYGVAEASMENLNVYGFFVNNLIPVTLGNMVGGMIFVGCIYYLSYKTKKKVT